MSVQNSVSAKSDDEKPNIEKLNVEIRVRVCGLCVQDGQVLLVRHKRFFKNDYFPEEAWILPGGALELGETAAQGTRRELLEETGLECVVGKLLFVKELIFPIPLLEKTNAPIVHSLSLCFRCRVAGGVLKTGRDPELSDSEQLILETRWLPIDGLQNEPVYPLFLTKFIQAESVTDFNNVTPHYFNSLDQ
jgi:8-oxo-dGTP diphosphatase